MMGGRGMIGLPRSASPFLVTIALTGAGITADYFIKRSVLSNNHGFLAIGAAIYAASALGWALVMENTALATIGVWYSTMIVVLLAALGYFVFHEALTLKQSIGIACAIAAIILSA
jgi:drug/metabolite transporter (DMT)-like permease